MLSVNAPGVLGNDSDADGDDLEVYSAWAPAHGSLSIWGDGHFKYTPDSGYTGPDTFGYNIRDNNGGTASAVVHITVLPVVVPVAIDIKPGSDPNSLNVHSKGVIPVAILGTDDFDTTQVDPETMRLSWDGISGIPGVPPLRWAWEDVNGDGLMDIVLKYSMGDLMTYTVTNEPPGDLIMTLTGNLMDGTPIEGYDTVRIINKLMD
jgi:hypothetical protein